MIHDDFSSNARSDTLDKYSRFFGKAEFSDWCNEPTLKYTEGFRDLLYQVNPHYISCVYKKMFDAFATNQLRIVDDDGVFEDEREMIGNPTLMGTTGQSNSEGATPRNFQSDSIDRSNSCIYSQTNGIGFQNCNKNMSGKTKNLSRWFTCERPHSASCTVYQTVSAVDTRDAFSRRSVYNRVLSPGTFHDNLRYGRQFPAKKRYPVRHGSASTPDNVSKLPPRETPDETSGRQCGGSASCISAINSHIKVGKCFKHFQRNASYMDQYREEYTYQKLSEVIEKNGFSLPETPICPCGNRSCHGSHSAQHASQCKQRWYPQQSQPNEKNRNVTSGIHAPKWPQALKPRSQHSAPKPVRVPVHVLQIPQLEGHQRKGVPWSNELKQKMGFFATSLTINNYNPTQPPLPCQPHNRCASTTMPSVITSRSGVSMKGHNSCSSTPTLQDRHLIQPIKRAI